MYLGVHGTPSSHAEYNRVIAEWLANQRQRHCSGAGLLITQLVARYFPHVQSYYRKNGRPTSEVNTVRSALQPLLDLYGHTPAGEFGPMALKALREAMNDRGWRMLRLRLCPRA